MVDDFADITNDRCYSRGHGRIGSEESQNLVKLRNYYAVLRKCKSYIERAEIVYT